MKKGMNRKKTGIRFNARKISRMNAESDFLNAHIFGKAMNTMAENLQWKEEKVLERSNST